MSETSWALSAEEWHRRKVHRIELESGMLVEMRLLSIGELLVEGALPEDLVEVAIKEWDASSSGTPSPTVREAAAAYDLADDAPDEEHEEAAGRAGAILDKLAALNRAIVAAALVAPKVTSDQIGEFPYADVEMLAGILQRRIHFDAAGRRIGVEPLDTFRAFAEEHGCAPDCEHCTSARGRVSSVHVGPV